MKKLVALLAFVGLGLGLFGGNETHASNCQEIVFNDAVLCVGIQKNSSTSYTVFRNITQSSSNLGIACDILLPNGDLKMVGSCNGTFSYNGASVGPVKIYAKVNNQYKTLESNYNFSLGQWTNSRNNNDWYGSSQLNNFSLSSFPSSLSSYQRADVTIRARNSNNSTITNYNGIVDFSVQYRSNNSSSWQNAPSSYYSLDRSSYTFSTWDNGQVTLNNLVRFTNNNYQYRLVARARNTNVTNYLYLNTSSSNNYSWATSLNIIPSVRYPEQYERTDVTIEAVDASNNLVQNYSQNIRFIVERQSGNLWYTASSSDYDLDRTSYTFSTSSNGSVKFYDLVRFRSQGTYRLRVYQQSNTSISDTMTFTIGSSQNWNNNTTLNNFTLTSYPSSLSSYQRADVTIRARNSNNSTITNYNGIVDFSVQYRSSNSSSWQNAPSSYYSLDRSSYTFSTWDNGQVTLNDLVRFTNNNYQYRLVARARNTNVTNYLYLNTSSSNNTSSVQNFGITSYPNSPSRNQRTDITIRARNSNNSTITNYNEVVDFSVQYRSSNSSSWQNAPSSYYSLDRSSYTFSTRNNGVVTLNDLVRFTNDTYNYRLVVRERGSNVFNYWYVCYTSNCTTTNNNNNAGFSSSERSRVQGIHTLWPSLIDDLESSYPTLRFNNSWQNTQQDLYQEMGKIAYGGNSIYNSYSAFYNAFIDWYSQTIQLVR